MNVTPVSEPRKGFPKWLKICLIIVGVVLIAFGLLGIFGNKSNSLVNKFNELQAPVGIMKDDLMNMSVLLTGIVTKEKEKDWAGITSDLQTALVKLNDASAQLASTTPVLDDFQNIVNGSSDQGVKTAGADFINVYKLRNAAAMKMINDGENLVNLSITYYGEIAKNQKITVDLAKISAYADAIGIDSQNMVNVNALYDTTVNNLAKAAGFTIGTK